MIGLALLVTLMILAAPERNEQELLETHQNNVQCKQVQARSWGICSDTGFNDAKYTAIEDEHGHRNLVYGQYGAAGEGLTVYCWYCEGPSHNKHYLNYLTICPYK